MTGKTAYDYIIIGAGSAGCVMANRLSANPEITVLLIEAGPKDRSPYIHMPAGLPKLAHRTDINWNYSTAPQPHLDNRRLWWPRGRVLGGCSSINAMCYTRGQPQDYDGWVGAGNPGWDWNSVLPWFRKSEDQQRGENDYHGSGGPLTVSDLRYHNVLSRDFIDAAIAAGFPRNDDFNGATQEGVGFYQVTQRDGRRCSAATAYLRPAKARANLGILTGAHVETILFRDNIAHAVRLRKGNQVIEMRARHEILLSAGAVNSPQLLLLSGIGASEDLQRFGIPVVHHLPGVGENLQDHLDICTIARIREAISYDMGPLREALVGLKYFMTRNGIGTTNAAEAGGFVRSNMADRRPDIQLHFVPAQLDDHGRNRMPGHGFTIHACGLRPASRGRIRLSSANPADAPLIDPNYLAHETDLEILLQALKISRGILSQVALAQHVKHEVLPGEASRTDDALVRFIRERAETIYHPVGSCRMGQDEMAVVDPQLKVHGIERLRVIDASVMPTLISGNTNAPTIMIAEKAADMILSGN